MRTRRALLGALIGTGGAIAAEARAAQPPGGQQGRTNDGGDLQNRGAPTGRTGAATRGADSPNGDVTVDLVAPLRGVGLTSAGEPTLYYILQGRADQPFRLTISTSGQARPLADFEFRHSRVSGLGTISLRERRVQLPPNLLCTWSLTLALNPRAPSQDLVCSALIEYRPGNPALRAADVSPEQRPAALAQAGYWYDAVYLAEQRRKSGHGEALAFMFREAELQMPADAGASARP